MESRTYIGKYCGKDICGFCSEHKYIFEISRTRYGYELLSTYDLTGEYDCNFYIRYASEISMKQNWNIETENE